MDSKMVGIFQKWKLPSYGGQILVIDAESI